MLRGKIVTDENFARFCLNQPRNGFSEKHVSSPFLRNRSSPIFGAKTTIWRVSRRNCHERKLRSLLSKTAPKLFFRKTLFLFVFTKPPPSPISGVRRTMWRVSRQNFHRRKLRSVLSKTASKSFFVKTRFRSVFTKLTLSPIFEARQTMWNVSRQNFHRWKLRSLCLNRPRNGFSKKHVPVCFYEIAPLTYFWGQTDYVARFEAKFSRTKTSLDFA